MRVSDRALPFPVVAKRRLSEIAITVLVPERVDPLDQRPSIERAINSRMISEEPP
jgi:hypothetical protein